MPKVCRFCVSVFPSEDDDVITSPYNGMLALSQLSEHADCVLPIENQALLQLIGGGKSKRYSESNNQGLSLRRLNVRSKITGTSFVPIWSHAKDAKSSRRKRSSGDETTGQSAYDSMNHIAASLIANLTCSSRFEGSLNVDLNEITTNLVPYVLFDHVHFTLEHHHSRTSSHQHYSNTKTQIQRTSFPGSVHVTTGAPHLNKFKNINTITRIEFHVLLHTSR